METIAWFGGKLLTGATANNFTQKKISCLTCKANSWEINVSENNFDQDSQLAIDARNGNNSAFEELVRRHQGQMHSFVYHFFRGAEFTEDITQDVFLRAYRFLHTYDPSRRFITWLYSIARNLCIDKHRERMRKEHVNIDDVPPMMLCSDNERDDPLAQVERLDDLRALREAIASLPEKYRTPIILCYLEGLPYQEISDVLGITLNNTKIRIFRAKKMLVGLLGAPEQS
jgi:RNA polymerase sigma-70 factor (ECF subfamily)